MSTGRTGAVVEIIGTALLVTVIVAMRVYVVAIIGMAVHVGMHRAVLVNVRMFVRPFDLCFPGAAAANCTHRLASSSNYSISISLTRISVPPVACNS